VLIEVYFRSAEVYLFLYNNYVQYKRFQKRILYLCNVMDYLSYYLYYLNITFFQPHKKFFTINPSLLYQTYSFRKN